MARSEQKVVQYLGEAHASEVALTRVLQSQIAVTPRGTVRSGLEAHLVETKDHASRLRERIKELDAGRNPLQAVVGLTETVIGQTLALSKTPLDLVRGVGGEEKILKNVKDACATEALEIATYDALEALAKAVGDERTATLAASIRADERAMLDRLLGEIPALAKAVVRAEVEGDPSFDPTTTGAADAVKEVRDAVTGAADEASTAVKGRATKARTTAKRTTTKAKADAKRTASRATSTAKAKTSRATTTAKETTAKATSTAKETTSKARAGATSAAKKTTASAAKQARKVPGAASAEGTVKGTVASATDLPIAGYDDKTVEEIDARLPDLSQVDLAKVAAYERRHQDRSTLLDRVDVLRVDEPWSGYDEQTAAEITKALKAATDATVRDVQAYERAHKARTGLTKAIERRLGPVT
ncbi:DUF892 family protein [Patulibacter minatonensis]|uniref:DUF892 family protein n=1 Tax=Patulibacter minatonensis TaxID=298163 RepID=UPI0004BBE0FA|nr:DUF892 family protein [Patulibacter minatonensis]